MKIMIIGSPGSGKSTFSRKLGDALNLPVYHLDLYFWQPGWVQTPVDEWTVFNEDLVMHDKWIIDGYYGKTLDIRMQAADVIILFDLSPWITTYRVIKRRIQYHGKSRPDLNEGCPESLDWELVKYSWNFRKNRIPGIIERLQKSSENTMIIIIKTSKEAEVILRNWTS
ncbi:DNA topology modulation protein [Paenibacillus endoradicis]|uniref:DNA topology modulation protein n=1 Tax=Paenibacillus endoradicis TaxID=2972487 RepID=UPI0021591D1D|nr:DNA topology modulation protein [Paenibacillus endoradicis]MCR8656636.1 DNA topology modulation protein [Paenibacillus endoradicis]